ncbi:hypothetical protein DIPPA_02991 [Diplonema papillatum]|nr:hypothetical protein DIPPA_02991 [Diplonema papillatum]
MSSGLAWLVRNSKDVSKIARACLASVQSTPAGSPPALWQPPYTLKDVTVCVSAMAKTSNLAPSHPAASVLEIAVRTSAERIRGDQEVLNLVGYCVQCFAKARYHPRKLFRSRALAPPLQGSLQAVMSLYRSCRWVRATPVFFDALHARILSDDLSRLPPSTVVEVFALAVTPANHACLATARFHALREALLRAVVVRRAALLRQEIVVALRALLAWAQADALRNKDGAGGGNSPDSPAPHGGRTQPETPHSDGSALQPTAPRSSSTSRCDEPAPLDPGRGGGTGLGQRGDRVSAAESEIPDSGEVSIAHSARNASQPSAPRSWSPARSDSDGPAPGRGGTTSPRKRGDRVSAAELERAAVAVAEGYEVADGDWHGAAGFYWVASNLGLGRLSPAVARRMEAVERMAAEHIEHFSPVDAASVLHAAALHAGRPDPARARVFLRFAELAVGSPGGDSGGQGRGLAAFEARSLANIVWSFAAAKVQPAASPHVREMLLQAAAHANSPSVALDFSQQQIANVLWAYASAGAGLRADFTMLEAVACGDDRTRRTEPKDAARIAWGLVKTGSPNAKRFVASVLASKGGDASFLRNAAAYDAVEVLWAMVKTNLSPSSAALELAAEKVAHRPPAAKKQRATDAFNPIPKLLWVMSALRTSNRRLTSSVVDAFCTSLPPAAAVEGRGALPAGLPTMQHVAMVARAAASLGLRAHPFFKRAYPTVRRYAASSSLDVNTVCTLSWAYAKADRGGPGRELDGEKPAPTVAQLLEPHILKAVPALTATQAAGLLRAMARARYTGSAVTPLTLRARSLIPALAPTEHASLLSALRSLSCASGYIEDLSALTRSNPRHFGDLLQNLREKIAEKP